MNKDRGYYQETYRPQIHFSPESEWLNDPNGLVYYKGEYHLFYQYNPRDTMWGTPHWGHAVSKDLFHWKHLPVTLKPDQLGYIFTGSVVVDQEDSSGFFNGDSGLVAIYTSAYQVDNDNFLQRQSIAYSKDRGRTWQKYAQNPVIPNPGVSAFRDPNVLWHDKTNHWVMVVSYNKKVRFYGSSNLKEWKPLSEFGEEYSAGEGDWECPELVQLQLAKGESKWVLIIGDELGGREGGSRTQYFVGDFDGAQFHVDDQTNRYPLRLDYGQDFYALQAWNNLPDERTLGIAWLSNLNYSEQIPSQGWRGMLSIPRELGLDRFSQGTELVQKPVKELHRLRCESWQREKLKVNSGSVFSPDVQGDVLEIVAEVKLESPAEFSFRLRKQDSERIVAGYRTDQQELFVDRQNAGNADFSEGYLPTHTAPLEPIDDKIQLHIFLDRSSLELFGNYGRRSITSIFFPSRHGKRVELKVDRGRITLSHIEIHRLKSIW